MCGRLNVISDPLSKLVSEALGIKFKAETNPDLRPTQTVSTIVNGESGIKQLDTSWGIKPSWANKLLINAQAETVAAKPTFKKAFEKHRCVVPCSGWYEWSTKQTAAKQKYTFTSEDEMPFYMAGIFYTQENAPPQLVTLTTSPNEECAPFHHRMPLLIPETIVEDWLCLDSEQLTALLLPPKMSIKITPAN